MTLGHWPFLLLSGLLAAGVPTQTATQAVQTRHQWPLSFEPNVGQADPGVRFVARGAGYSLLIRDQGTFLSLGSKTSGDARIEMRLRGARTDSPVRSQERQPGVSNYIIGNNPAMWRKDVPHYGRVEYQGVYPGVDFVLYGNQGQVEYDFVLAPGADPSRIRMEFRGQTGLRLEDGDLVLSLNGEAVRLRRPVLYQPSNTGRKSVEGRFVARGATVGFEVGTYDRRLPLVIDPVLVYSSYFGGSDWDRANAVAVDASGNTYVVGDTLSTGFPTTGAYQGTKGNGYDAFVVKINNATNTLTYSTFIGGDGTDYGKGIAVDSSSQAVITGQTGSSNWPLLNAIDSTLGGTEDAFVMKLNAIGNGLVYSTYFGGTSHDAGFGVAVDGVGNAYVVGETAGGLTTLNAAQSVLGGGWDAFVAKFTTGGALGYSTYLGGSYGDWGYGIGVNAAGSACVTGQTQSTNFPTLNAKQASMPGVFGAYVVRYNPSGGVIYSTYLAGSGWDEGRGAAINAAGNCYVTGKAYSTNFPVFNAAQATSGSSPDAFVAAYDPSGANFLYSTYLGGQGTDFGYGIALDGLGGVTVTGSTSSPDFPLMSPFRASGGGGVLKSTDTGANWAPTGLGGNSIYSLAIPTDSNFGTVLLAGTSAGVYRSNDGGQTWNAPVLTTASILAMSVSPVETCRVYAATSAGAYMRDCAGNWTAFGSLATANSISAANGNAQNVLYTGTQYVNSSWYDSRCMRVGSTINCSFFYPRMNDLVAATDPANACTNYSGDGTGAIFRNLDCAVPHAGWVNLNSGLTSAVKVITPHPTNQSTVLVGTTTGIYRKDGAGGFNLVVALDGAIQAIVYHPTDSNIVFAGTEGGTIYKSVNGGSNWSPVAATGRGVASLALSAALPGVVQAGLMSGSEAFITKLSPSGAIQFSSLFGGSGADEGLGVALDSSGVIHLAGSTASWALPVRNTPYTTFSGKTDGFVAKIDLNGSCTYSLGAPVFPAPVGGTSGTVTMTATAGCLWTVLTPPSWILFGPQTDGVGNGSVRFVVLPNNTGVARSGSVSIGGQTFTVNQDGPQPPVGITVTTSPAQLQIVVDGTTYTAPQTFNWGPGSVHTIGGVSPQSGGAGIQYVFASWSDGQAQSHQITTPASAATYTATFGTQYLLTLAVSPPASGTITGSAGYYNAGQSVQLTANPNTGYGFGYWSGALTGGANPQSVVMNGPRTVTANFTPGLQFIPITPCRIMDTRPSGGFAGAFGPPSLVGMATRSIPIPSSSCGIPSTANAYSLNVTVIPKVGTLAFLSIWPAGQAQPNVSTLNSWDGSILANAAIVPAGTSGAINVLATDNADLVIDINGYFAPPTASSLQFYPLTPCRVLDTRNAAGTFGGPNLNAGVSRSFPFQSSSCSVPATAQSYSLNVTAVPIGPLGYLTTWPTGQPQPLVSTLNAMDGTVLANAAIVPAGTGGAVSFYASNNTHLVVDINGYFAPPGAGGLNFYTLLPCRIMDTRNAAGPFGGPIVNGVETRAIPVRQSACGLPASSQAYSLNMTVVPPGFLSFLAVWPTGLAWNGVSTLNDYKGLAVANAALVPAGTNGAVNIYTSNPSHVIMDINGYFGQ